MTIRPTILSTIIQTIMGTGSPGGASSLLLNMPLQTSIIPTKGTGSPTYTRSTVATFQNFEGRILEVPSGCARFEGARFVRNLATSSGDFSTAGSDWTVGESGLGVGKVITFSSSGGSRVFTAIALPTGSDLVVSLDFSTADSGKTIRLGVFSGSWDYGSDITIPSDGKRVSRLISNVPGAVQYIAIANDSGGGAQSVTVATGILVEDVTGQANQNPSEYVSTGVLSSPWHGANVDGCKYFKTKNGNTVLDNVVTEATGAAITHTSTQVARLPGASGDYFSTPDSAANSVTGDIDIRGHLSLDAWTPLADNMTLISKYTSSGTYSYILSVQINTGKLQLVTSNNGTGVEVNASSTVSPSVDDGGTIWLRCTLSISTGEVKFYTSESGVTWDQLGTTLSVTATAIFDGTAPVEVGGFASGTDNALKGTIHSAQVYDGINGTLVVDFNPEDYVSGTTFNASSTGETWTVNGDASIYGSGRADASGPFGYLSESGSSNLMLWSQSFDNAAYLKSRSTVSSTAQTLPNGSTGIVNTLKEDSTVSSTHTLQQNITVADSTDYTFSVYAKAMGRDWFYLEQRLKDGSFVGAYFDLDTGVVGTVSAGITASIESVSGGWYRCAISVNSATGGSTFSSRFLAATGDGGVSYTGADIDSLAFFGAQLEASTFPSSYIQTEASAVTRNADVLTMPDTGNIEDAAGTAIAETYSNSLGATGASRYAIASGASVAMAYTQSSQGSWWTTVFDGTGPATALKDTGVHRFRVMASSWGAGLTAYMDGDAGTTATYSGNMADGTLGVGVRASDSTRQFNGTVRNVKIHNKEGVV